MSLAARSALNLRWLRRSSTLRLTLLLSLVFSFGMALAVFVSLFLGRDAVLDRIDTSLEDLARSVAMGDAPDETFSTIIRPLAELGDLPHPFSSVAQSGGGTVNLDRDFRQHESWRVRVEPDTEGRPVMIAVPLDESEDALELLEGILWTTAIVVVGIAFAVGSGAGILAERRMARISSTLDRLASGELQARTGIETSFDDLDDLARQLDNTAAQLERMVAQTRHLSASIAHDLRTPLARLRAHLETLPEGMERDLALEEAEHLSGIFDTIMRVARIEAQQGTEGFVAVDLGALAAELSETFGPVVEDSGKSFVLDVTGAGTVQGDRAMLVQAVANLLQNALVHGGPEVTLIAREKSIGVSDNGVGVAPAHYPEIIKPMVRLDGARTTEGTGLGLTLVAAVADRHGAALALSEEEPQGLRVMLKFADL